MQLSSFFNSINHDRVYAAADWAAYFSSFIGNGVFPQPSNGLQVVAGSGMTVTVRMGKAWINGYFYRNTTDLAVTLNTADGAMKRYDRIVLRWDLTERTITVVVKSSQYSANPTPPALQRDADAYELCLADVLVNNGVTSIAQASITDQRFNTALCGIVVGVITQIDPSVITAQFDNFFALYEQLVIQRYGAYNEDITEHENAAQSDYDAFVAMLNAFGIETKEEAQALIDSVRGILGDDVAGQLAQEILVLQGRVDVLEEEVSKIPKFTMEAWLSDCYLGNAFLSTIN